jgi:hypothetical protein
MAVSFCSFWRGTTHQQIQTTDISPHGRLPNYLSPVPCVRWPVLCPMASWQRKFHAVWTRIMLSQKSCIHPKWCVVRWWWRRSLTTKQWYARRSGHSSHQNWFNFPDARRRRNTLGWKMAGGDEIPPWPSKGLHLARPSRSIGHGSILLCAESRSLYWPVIWNPSKLWRD